MGQSLFMQNIIACIWDFDKTLIPGYMQAPLFAHYNVDEKQFWAEVARLPQTYRESGLDMISSDTVYLNHLLTYVASGIFGGLNNRLLRELGAKLEFYPGLPGFFEKLRSTIHEQSQFARHDIRVEHYIISTGLRQMILGSRIAPFIDGVWGCEFVETPPSPDYLRMDGPSPAETPERPISQMAYVLDNTTKTRAIFEINKGSNKVPGIDVNATMPEADRRIPIRHMIYVADGPSDVPVFSVLNRFGGRTFAVYRAGSDEEFSQVNQLQKQGRVQSFGEANYQEGSQTSMWLKNAVTEIAEQMVRHREATLGERVGKPPTHLNS